MNPDGERNATISVALCTYNGAAHLAEQLASLAAQTRMPDELIVGDDRSTDATSDVVAQFAASAPFPVRFHVNKEQLGSSRNFERTISLCSGDVIFLCDQDDVWRAGKIERMVDAMESSRAGLAFSDAELCDGDMRPLGARLWDVCGFPHAYREMMRAGNPEILVHRNVVWGCCLAFRSLYRDLALPAPESWHHDAALAVLIASVAPVAVLDEPLVAYRQHASQERGMRPRSRRQRAAEAWQRARSGHEDCVRSIAHWEPIRDRLLAYAETYDVSRGLSLVEGKLAHTRARQEIRGVRQFPRAVRELTSGRYDRYSNGWRGAVKDLLFG